MKKKKDRAKKAQVDTPLDKLDEKETIMHYNAVLIEALRSEMKLVLERVDALDTKFESKIDTFKNELASKIDFVKDALECKFERHFSTLESAIRGLKGDMLDMEQRLSSKINRIIDRCENHECRLTTLEASQ